MRFALPTRHCLAVLASLALSASACADRDVVTPPDAVAADVSSPDDLDDRSDLDIVRIDASPSTTDSPATDSPTTDTSPLVRFPDSPATADTPSAACACSDDDCVRTWIEQQLGCDVCALIVCAPGVHVGGCVRCPAITPAPDPAP